MSDCVEHCFDARNKLKLRLCSPECVKHSFCPQNALNHSPAFHTVKAWSLGFGGLAAAGLGVQHHELRVVQGLLLRRARAPQLRDLEARRRFERVGDQKNRTCSVTFEN